MLRDAAPLLAVPIALFGWAAWELRRAVLASRVEVGVHSWSTSLRLFLAGILVSPVGYVLGVLLFLPAIQALAGAPRRGCVDTMAEILQQAASFGAGLGAAAWTLGWVSRHFRKARARDAYWVSNPATTILGFMLLHFSTNSFLGQPMPDREMGYSYWSLTTWLMVAILPTPLYARAFLSGARNRQRGTSEESQNQGK